MNIKSKGFISDVFKNSILSGQLKDVRQPIVYNYTKSYPSVNSSNSGQIHSEENVRWLTKQFTKKPFIIQYDNNDMEEFQYQGSILNAGIATGGMVNIDGYIINSATDMTKLSFDNTEDTKLGTGDNGYINHQALQQASLQFMGTLQNSSIDEYLNDSSESSDTPTIKNYITQLQNTYTQLPESECWNYIRLCFSNVYKKAHKESINTNEFIYSYTYYWTDEEDVTHSEERIYKIPVDYNIGEATGGNTNTCGYISKLDIQYTGDVKEYIENNFDVASLETDYSIIESVTETENSITITYKMFFGIIGNKLQPTKKAEDDDIYLSTLYVTDIFGFYYLFNSNLSVRTHTYPSTFRTDIDFIEDTVTPTNHSASEHIIRGTRLIYDTSTMYRKVNVNDENYDNLLQAIEPYQDEVINIDNFYIRPNTLPSSPSLLYVDAVLDNNHFKNISFSSIITTYNTYNDTTADISTLSTGHLKNLCDKYYCLNLNDDILRLFGIPSYDNNYVPVGFMTSSGALMIRNYERTFDETYKNAHPSEQYQSSYVNSTQNETIYQQIYIEGYVSFFRRVCAKLYGIDITNISGPYGNISNLNEYDNIGWNHILKDIQYGDLEINPTADVINSVDIVKAFFNVEDIQDITFDILYNTLLAPYVNLYTQLAWSDLVINTTDYTNNNFKSAYAGSQIKQIPSADIVEDNINYIVVATTHKYSEDYIVPKDIKYELNTYSDYDRLNLFLCSQDTQKITEGLETRTPITLNNLTLPSRAELCQDYISYIRGCSRTSWEDNQNYDYTYVQTSFKITSLDTFTNNYDNFAIFNRILDKFANYTRGKNNTVSCDILPGYIQNVKISTSTLLPTHSVINNHYKWFGTDVIAGPNPMYLTQFELSLAVHSNIEYDGAQIPGVSGYHFAGSSQGWVMAIPTLFRLYKDSQDYLNGRLRGSIYHAGIYIDYKLPVEIQEMDFWFTNTWLSSVRTIREFDIENNGANYPQTVDGMTNYLQLRNHTLFSTDVIYDIDENGNYLSLKSYIENIAGDYITYLQEYIESEPDLSYVDFVDDEEGDKLKICQPVIYSGVYNNLKRLKQCVDDLSWESQNMQSNLTSYNIEIENNKYYDLKDTLLNTLNISCKTNTTAGNINRYAINTTSDYSSNTILHATIRTTFSSTLNISLDTILNGFTEYYREEGYGIPVFWDSNYPVKIFTDTNTNITTYNITVDDYITTGNVPQCLIELDIHTNTDKTSAVGHCNISIISSEKTMTQMDMNYLFKELYKLDRISWEQVSYITQTGLAEKFWNLGDTKTFNVTYNGITYPIQAMIIGFDQESSISPRKPHNITWMTNIYNNSNLDVSEISLFNKQFPADLAYTLSGGRKRYNTKTNDVLYDGYELEVVYWMNNSILECTDTEFLSVVAYCNKTNGLLYTCSDDNNYKIISPATYNHIGGDLQPSSDLVPLKFWLPSLTELGLSFTEDDIIERTINTDGDINGDRLTRNDSLWSYDGVQYRTVEAKSNEDYSNLVYSYFKQNKNQQNIKSITMLTRSYYSINLDLTTLETPTTVESYEYQRGSGDFDTCHRILYSVGAGYSNEFADGRWFTILHKEDVQEILRNKINTDFCFITI